MDSNRNYSYRNAGQHCLQVEATLIVMWSCLCSRRYCSCSALVVCSACSKGVSVCVPVLPASDFNLRFTCLRYFQPFLWWPTSCQPQKAAHPESNQWTATPQTSRLHVWRPRRGKSCVWPRCLITWLFYCDYISSEIPSEFLLSLSLSLCVCVCKWALASAHRVSADLLASIDSPFRNAYTIYVGGMPCSSSPEWFITSGPLPLHLVKPAFLDLECCVGTQLSPAVSLP